MPDEVLKQPGLSAKKRRSRRRAIQHQALKARADVPLTAKASSLLDTQVWQIANDSPNIESLAASAKDASLESNQQITPRPAVDISDELGETRVHQWHQHRLDSVMGRGAAIAMQPSFHLPSPINRTVTNPLHAYHAVIRNNGTTFRLRRRTAIATMRMSTQRRSGRLLVMTHRPRGPPKGLIPGLSDGDESEGEPGTDGAGIE